MILLARGLAQLVTFVMLAALAVAGAAAALFSLGSSGDLSLPGLARQVDLPGLRDEVARLLAALEAGGPVAIRSALAGACTVAAGVLLLVGALWPRRERLVVLGRGDQGELAARRRALGQAATALAEQTRGVSVRRARLRPRRRGRGGRLTLKAARAGSLSGDQVRERTTAALEPLTEAFALRPSIRSKPGGTGL